MMRAPLPLVRLLLAGCALCGTSAGAVAAPAAKVHTVVIEGMRFIPAELSVNAGDTVNWKNKDAFPHTVTSEGKQFDSRDIAPGGSWKLVASRRGSIAYVCTLHKTMKGTLSVK
jgi:plastocyanin